MRGPREGSPPRFIVGMFVTVVGLVGGCPAAPEPEPGPHEAALSLPPAPPPGPEAVALLGGLEIGERVAGWEVVEIRGPTDGVLRIDLLREDRRFAIMVARHGVLPNRPPVKTDRYAIYYGHAHPPGTTIPDGAIRAVTHAFKRRIDANQIDANQIDANQIDANQIDVPTPAGM